MSSSSLNRVDSQKLLRLEQLLDRQEILDCLLRFSRGMDRFDRELFLSAFHSDAIIAAGEFVGGPKEIYTWASQLHEQGQSATNHYLLNHSCDIDGDVAHAESYVIGLFLNPDGETARLLTGRYVDRLERRDGEWRIALRRCTVEVIMQADASLIKSDYVLDMGFLKGLRDRQDVSYQRPLSLEDTPTGHRW